MNSVFAKAIRGGGVGGIRQVLAGVMSLVTAILLSRLLGPNDFAVYALCLALTVFLTPVSRMGIHAWLMSQEEMPDKQTFEIALGGMLAFSIFVALLTICGLPFWERFSKIEQLFLPALFTVALLPLEVWSLAPMTKMERDLDYGNVMRIELVGQFIGQFLAVVLVYLGFGIWGPLMGWFFRSLYKYIACSRAAYFFPRPRWDLLTLKPILRFGLWHTVYSLVNSSRNLILLSMIGQWFGKEAVGIVGLVLRVADFMTPMRAVVSRLIVPVLAPLSNASTLMDKAQQKAAELEILISTPIAIGGLLIYSYLATPLLGSAWEGSVAVLPWVLASQLLIIPHRGAMSAFLLKGYFISAIAANATGYLLVLAMVWGLGHALGLVGIGMAMLAFWVPFFVIHGLSRARLKFQWNPYAQLWAWTGALACLTLQINVLWLLPCVLVYAMTWRKILSLFNEVLRVLKNEHL